MPYRFTPTPTPLPSSLSLIISELSKTYGSYGITVDMRHTQLLADIMTYRGAVLGITRFGIAKMKVRVWGGWGG